MSNGVRIIKRYQNRKLYDTHQSCYVTLAEIFQLLREGHEIQVIDNKTKNDLTCSTQIQILFEQERKTTSGGDTELLKRVIRGGEGTFTKYIRMLEKGLSGQSISGDSSAPSDTFAFSRSAGGDQSTEISTTVQ